MASSHPITTAEGGLNRHTPELIADGDSWSRPDQDSSQYDSATGISQGDAAPINDLNELAPQDSEAMSIYSAARMDEPARPLRWWDVSSLIINKMIGTGIYTAPPAVLILTGNKREALGLWITGFIYTLIR